GLSVTILLMNRPTLIIALAVLILTPLALADSHTDDKTGFTIDFPSKWELDQADAVVANAPDHLASMIVISFKDVRDADALQRLDTNDIMGTQIKTLTPD